MKMHPCTRSTREFARLGFVIVILAAVGGCSSRSGEIASGPTYPSHAQAGSLDIQVVRDGTSIRMTNTTARSLAAGRIWANRWYSTEFPGLGVGETLSMELGDFKDQYGDAFRAGGFFATERPAQLVQAQLELGEELIGLVVISTLE